MVRWCIQEWGRHICPYFSGKLLQSRNHNKPIYFMHDTNQGPLFPIRFWYIFFSKIFKIFVCPPPPPTHTYTHTYTHTHRRLQIRDEVTWWEPWIGAVVFQVYNLFSWSLVLIMIALCIYRSRVNLILPAWFFFKESSLYFPKIDIYGLVYDNLCWWLTPFIFANVYFAFYVPLQTDVNRWRRWYACTMKWHL